MGRHPLLTVFLSAILAMVTTYNKHPDYFTVNIPAIAEKPDISSDEMITRLFKGSVTLVVTYDMKGINPDTGEELKQSSKGVGSGVINQASDGNTYILTAGHNIPESPHVDVTIENTKYVVFQELMKDSLVVGKISGEAELLGYDPNIDIAILKLKDNVFDESHDIDFYLNDRIPCIGTDIYHIGSFFGSEGHNSLSKGIVSKIGELVPDCPFDKTDLTMAPGSSGGGVFRISDGKCIGIMVRYKANNPNINFFTPIRVIKEWAEKQGLSVALT